MDPVELVVRQYLSHKKPRMKKMQDMLTEGGKCIWVAPSGGRDRADENNDYKVRRERLARRQWAVCTVPRRGQPPRARLRTARARLSRDGSAARASQVAPFDAKSVDMFKLMAAKSKRPAHFYPLSMFTYPICPPPQQARRAARLQSDTPCALPSMGRSRRHPPC